MAAIELGWEALTTAERIAPGFAAIVDTEKRESVDVRFLSVLERELLRLQWMPDS